MTQGLAVPAEASNPGYSCDVACVDPSGACRLAINLDSAAVGEHDRSLLLQLRGGFMNLARTLGGRYLKI